MLTDWLTKYLCDWASEQCIEHFLKNISIHVLLWCLSLKGQNLLEKIQRVVCLLSIYVPIQCHLINNTFDSVNIPWKLFSNFNLNKNIIYIILYHLHLKIISTIKVWLTVLTALRFIFDPLNSTIRRIG